MSEALLKAANRLVGLEVYSWDPRTGELQWTDGICRMWGLPAGHPVDFDTFLKGVHPDDVDRVQSAIAQALDPAGDGTYAAEYRVIGIADGVERWISTWGQVEFDGSTATNFVGVVVDTTGRKRDEGALRESEEKYRSLFNSIDEGFCIIEVLFDEAGQAADYRFLETNAAFERQTGLVGAVGRTMRELEPAHEQHWFDIYGRVALTGESERFERPAEALGYYYDVSAFRIGEPEQRRVAILFDDITERKRSEEALRQSERQAQSLLAQLQHRVRNTLAVVRSIARRTADRSETTDELISHFEGRLNAFSRVQSAVSRSRDAAVDFKAIVEDELLAVATREGEHLRIRGPDLSLKARAAESLSLAIHELATNAVKFGALATARGRVSIMWHRLPDHGTEELQLEWVESGLEKRPSPEREGFGHEMLLRTLPYDLRAKSDIEFTDDGMKFTLHMPLGPDVLAE